MEPLKKESKEYEKTNSNEEFVSTGQKNSFPKLYIPKIKYKKQITEVNKKYISNNSLQIIQEIIGPKVRKLKSSEINFNKTSSLNYDGSNNSFEKTHANEEDKKTLSSTNFKLPKIETISRKKIENLEIANKKPRRKSENTSCKSSKDITLNINYNNSVNENAKTKNNNNSVTNDINLNNFNSLSKSQPQVPNEYSIILEENEESKLKNKINVPASKPKEKIYYVWIKFY